MANWGFSIVFNPYGLFYCETDEEKNFSWRVCSAFKKTITTIVIVCAILMPAYATMNYAYIPVTAQTCQIGPIGTEFYPFVSAYEDSMLTDSICIETSGQAEIRILFPVYVAGACSFIGWFMMIFFLPTGMWAFVFEYIGAFVLRPKKIDDAEFNRAKSALQNDVKELLRLGKELELERKNYDRTAVGRLWWFQRLRKNYEFDRRQHLFEKNCMIAEREFQKLDDQAAYGERVEPAKYWLYLFQGIIFAILSVVIMVHIFTYKALKSDGKNVDAFLNRWLENIEGSQAGFVATILLILIGWYLMAATQKGVTKLGLRFFFLNFYPIIPKETFVSAFYANALAMNLWSIAVCHLMVDLFRGYLRSTEAALMFQVQIEHLSIFKWFWENNIFIVWIIVWWFISLIYFILKPTEKIDLGNKVKRADLGSKN